MREPGVRQEVNRKYKRCKQQKTGDAANNDAKKKKREINKNKADQKTEDENEVKQRLNTEQ